jgi:hypothetical protein
MLMAERDHSDAPSQLTSDSGICKWHPSDVDRLKCDLFVSILRYAACLWAHDASTSQAAIAASPATGDAGK